nr:lymphotoxin-beta isoform X2 [Odocoileus virginianus texanus]
MGERGLEGRGRRPQRKGCLLLAVAGVTSLVTLLLAVPITVVAVLALVPQEQEGLSPGSCLRRTQKLISALGSQLPISLVRIPISLVRIPSH